MTVDNENLMRYNDLADKRRDGKNGKMPASAGRQYSPNGRSRSPFADRLGGSSSLLHAKSNKQISVSAAGSSRAKQMNIGV